MRFSTDCSTELWKTCAALGSECPFSGPSNEERPAAAGPSVRSLLLGLRRSIEQNLELLDRDAAHARSLGRAHRIERRTPLLEVVLGAEPHDDPGDAGGS